jgi:hypothetical protein
LSQHGALLVAAHPDLPEALDRVLRALGFGPDERVERLGVPNGWLAFFPLRGGERRGVRVEGLSPGLALAVARGLAAELSCEVECLRVSVPATSEPRLEHHAVDPAGQLRERGLAAEITAMHEPSWLEIADGKPYFLARSCLDAMAERALPAAEEASAILFQRPPSLGSSRLDELAERVRSSKSATRQLVAGRAALRIVGLDGSVTTSFPTGEELRRLEAAVGPIR